MSKSVISTVVTAASTHDLTLLATVREDFGISTTDASDNFLGRAISRASAAAENFCNRVFAAETVKDEFLVDRDSWPHMVIGGIELLQPIRWPIVSISSIVEDGATLSPLTDFRLDGKKGQIVRLDSDGYRKRWRGNVAVTYLAGYVLPGQVAGDFPGAEKLPLDIEDAVGRMVYARFIDSTRNPFVRSDIVDGIGRLDYITPNPKNSDGGNMSADVIDLLNNYRVPVIA